MVIIHPSSPPTPKTIIRMRRNSNTCTQLVERKNYKTYSYYRNSMKFPQKDSTSNILEVELALKFYLYCTIKPENTKLSDDNL